MDTGYGRETSFHQKDIWHTLSEKVGVFEERAIVLCTLALLFSVIGQTLFRWLSISVVWTEEITRYLFIWICYLGVAIGTRLRDHGNTTFLIDRFPSKVRKWILFSGDIVFIAFCLLTLYSGSMLVIKQFMYKRIATTIPVPAYIISIIIPLSFLFCVLHLLRWLCRTVPGKNMQ